MSKQSTFTHVTVIRVWCERKSHNTLFKLANVKLHHVHNKTCCVKTNNNVFLNLTTLCPYDEGLVHVTLVSRNSRVVTVIYSMS